MQHPSKPTYNGAATTREVLNYSGELDAALNGFERHQHQHHHHHHHGAATAPSDYGEPPAAGGEALGAYLAGCGDYLPVTGPLTAAVLSPELLGSLVEPVPDLLQACSVDALTVDGSTPSASSSVSELACVGAAGSAPMVYPMVYVSPAGLLTVLLRFDVAVEMTTDRTIRVVNHRHKSVAATNSRGNASCIYHTAAKIYQEDTTTEVDVYWERRAKMTTEAMLFASGPSCYTLGSTSGNAN